MTAALTHKEMTAHLRNRLKAAGVKARVRMFVTCGVRLIQVFGATPAATFTVEEIRNIALIASVNGLTQAQRSRIDIDHEARLTGKVDWSFEYHSDLVNQLAA